MDITTPEEERQGEERNGQARKKRSRPVEDEHREHRAAGLSKILGNGLEETGVSGLRVHPDVDGDDAHSGRAGLDQRLHAVGEARVQKDALQRVARKGAEAGRGVADRRLRNAP